MLLLDFEFSFLFSYVLFFERSFFFFLSSLYVYVCVYFVDSLVGVLVFKIVISIIFLNF